MISTMQAKLYAFRKNAASRGHDRADEFGRMSKSEQIELLFWFVSKLTDRVDELERDLSTMEGNLTTFEADLGNLIKNPPADLSGEVEDLERRVEDLEHATGDDDDAA